MKIPELELELASGTLGGLVTTVEGLISKIGESKFLTGFLSSTIHLLQQATILLLIIIYSLFGFSLTSIVRNCWFEDGARVILLS